MRAVRRALVPPVVAILAATSIAARAELPQTGARIDAAPVAAPGGPFLRTEGPHEPAADGVTEATVSVGLELARGPLRATGIDTRGASVDLGAVVKDALLVRFAASIAPLSWLSLDASLPLAAYERGEAIPAYAGTRLMAPESPALGDFRFGARLRVLDRKELGLSLGGHVWAPVGSTAAYLSDAHGRGFVDVAIAGEGSSSLFGCTLGVDPTLFASEAGARASLACALHAKIASDVLSIGVEPLVAVQRLAVPDDATRLGVDIEPLGALAVRAGPIRVAFAAGPGFGRAPGTATFRGMLRLDYVGTGSPAAPPAPPPRDGDLDGIPDSSDACPDEAGPPSRDPSKNGCPARDRDGDGVRDDEDACPDAAGIRSTNPKANGCPDSDDDGVPDAIDACPREPGKVDGCPRFAHLVDDKFEIKPPIELVGDQLARNGRAAIEEIAATVRANPKIRIVVWVGAAGAPKTLAQRRVESLSVVLRGLLRERFDVNVDAMKRAGTVDVTVVR